MTDNFASEENEMRQRRIWLLLALLAVAAPAAIGPYPYWIQQRHVAGETLNAVYKTDDWYGGPDVEVWAVGNHGLVLHTTDGGLTWPSANLGSGWDLTDIHFTHLEHEYNPGLPVIGWITGYDRQTLAPVLFRSSDLGATWHDWMTHVPDDFRWSPRGATPFMRVMTTGGQWQDNIHGYIGCGNGDVLHTDNNGDDWYEPDDPPFPRDPVWPDVDYFQWVTGCDVWDANAAVGLEGHMDPNYLACCGDQRGPVSFTSDPLQQDWGVFDPSGSHFAMTGITSISGQVAGGYSIGAMHLCGTDAKLYYFWNTDPNWNPHTWQYGQPGVGLPTSVWFSANATFRNHDPVRKLRPSLNVASSGVKLKYDTYNGDNAWWEWPYHCYSSAYYDLRDVSYSECDAREARAFDPVWTVGTNGVILKRIASELIDVCFVTAQGQTSAVKFHALFQTTSHTDHVYVYRGPSEDGPWELKHTEDVPGQHPDNWQFDWYDYGVRYSIPYFYKICVNEAPAYQPRIVVSAIPSGLPIPQFPTAPTNLALADVPADNGWSVQLTWNAPPSTWCLVYRKNLDLTPTQPADYFDYVGASTSGSLCDINAMPDIHYSYRVRAYDGDADAASAPIQQDGSSHDNVPPPQPAGLAVAYLPEFDAVSTKWHVLEDDPQFGSVNTIGGYQVNASLNPFPIAQDLNEGPILFPARMFAVNPGWRGHTTWWYVRGTDRSQNLGPYSDGVAINIPSNPSSNNSQATGPNTGPRLARDPGGVRSYVAYQAYGRVMQASSPDWGLTWDALRTVDLGGASAIRPSQPGLPIETYVRDNAVWGAVMSLPGRWKHVLLYQADSFHRVCPPALAVPPPPPTSSRVYGFAAFAVLDVGAGTIQDWVAKFDSGQVFVQPVPGAGGAAADSFVSIACTPGDAVHLVWQSGQAVRYSTALIPPSLWGPMPFSPAWQVSTAPARHPSTEAFGDLVWTAWCDVQTNTVVRSNHFTWAIWSAWSAPVPLSPPGIAADYPSCTKNGIAAWQQANLSGKQEIWANWTGLPMPVSAMPDSNNKYPHADAVVEPNGLGIPVVTSLCCAWTEEVVPDSLYQVRLRSVPLQDKLVYSEPAFSAFCGESVPSPYCKRRTGRGNRLGHAFDISTDSLSFQIATLDRRYGYIAELVCIHDRVGNFEQIVRANGVAVGRVRFGSARCETLRVVIPHALYAADGSLKVALQRLTGEYAASVTLKLYAFEVASGSQGSGQEVSYESPLGFVATRLVSCGPNPVRGQLRLQLDASGQDFVHVEVVDATGRTVKDLAHGVYPRGRHNLTWNLRDELGRRVPSGVYFCTMDAGSKRTSRKVVLTD